MQHFQVLPDLQKIKTYTNPTKPNLTKVLGATISMPSLGGKPPKPPNQGIQSNVLFGDLEIRRSEILRLDYWAHEDEVPHLHELNCRLSWVSVGFNFFGDLVIRKDESLYQSSHQTINAIFETKEQKIGLLDWFLNKSPSLIISSLFGAILVIN